jgi:Ser/Thr protein kinase RdoA (MazF antagonist)
VLSRRSQITRLRRVAEAAVEQYPLADGRLRFIGHGENTTFRHDSAAGSHLVRVHRPRRHGHDMDASGAIRSEIAWLTAIRDETDLHVPEALASRDGALTVEATARDETRTCSVLRWMEGRIHEQSPRPVHLRRLGEAMATLHVHADAWTPPAGFVRIDWGPKTFFGDEMVYGRTSARECWALFPEDLRGRFEALAEHVRPLLSAPRETGLIHADLHLGNALFEGGTVKLIDFDDCGTGHRLYDVAVAAWELRHRPDYAAFREALVSGYTAVRPIHTARLDDFIALRQFAFQIWFTGMAQVNPDFAARLGRVERWSASMLDLLEAQWAGHH